MHEAVSPQAKSLEKSCNCQAMLNMYNSHPSQVSEKVLWLPSKVTHVPLCQVLHCTWPLVTDQARPIYVHFIKPNFSGPLCLKYVKVDHDKALHDDRLTHSVTKGWRLKLAANHSHQVEDVMTVPALSANMFALNRSHPNFTEIPITNLRTEMDFCAL